MTVCLTIEYRSFTVHDKTPFILDVLKKCMHQNILPYDIASLTS